MFERFGRYIPVVAAAIAIVAAVVVLSRIVLTLDTIAHPGYRIAYLAGVAALLAGFAAFAWLKLKTPKKGKPQRQLKRRPPPEARLEDLFARHRLDEQPSLPRGHASPARRSGEPGRFVLAIAGVRGAGKSAVVAALTKASEGIAAARPLAVDLRELDSLDTDRGRNLERLAPALAADLTLFVVDQDLRDYEQAAIAALARREVHAVVVINKIDLMRPEALAETRQAIAGKLAGLLAETDILGISAAPRPLLRLVGEGDDLHEEEVAVSADISAITNRLERIAGDRGRDGLRISSASA